MFFCFTEKLFHAFKLLNVVHRIVQNISQINSSTNYRLQNESSELNLHLFKTVSAKTLNFVTFMELGFIVVLLY